MTLKTRLPHFSSCLNTPQGCLPLHLALPAPCHSPRFCHSTLFWAPSLLPDFLYIMSQPVSITMHYWITSLPLFSHHLPCSQLNPSNANNFLAQWVLQSMITLPPVSCYLLACTSFHIHLKSVSNHIVSSTYIFKFALAIPGIEPKYSTTEPYASPFFFFFPTLFYWGRI